MRSRDLSGHVTILSQWNILNLFSNRNQTNQILFTTLTKGKTIHWYSDSSSMMEQKTNYSLLETFLMIRFKYDGFNQTLQQVVSLQKPMRDTDVTGN